MKERIKHLILLIILIGIDQGSKLWVKTVLMNKKPIIIIPKTLNLQYLENRGAVWGILNGKVDFLRILTIVILLLILYLYFRIPEDRRFRALKILVVFILAGAIGNMIDRFSLGYVVDFIYFELINFPVFNFADSCLTVSSILLLVFALFYYKDEDFIFLEQALFRKKKKNSSTNGSKDLINDRPEEEAKEDNSKQ